MKQIILILFTVGVLMIVFLAVKQNKKFGDNLPSPTLEINQPVENSQSTNSVLVLSVESPVNNSKMNSASVLVKGKTGSNAEVFVNEKELRADNEGNFSTSLDLEEGENYILISANDSEGNYVEKEIVVNVEITE